MWHRSFSVLTNIGYAFVLFYERQFLLLMKQCWCMLCVRLCGAVFILWPQMRMSWTRARHYQTWLVWIPSQTKTRWPSRYKPRRNVPSTKLNRSGLIPSRKAINDLNVFCCFYELLHRVRNSKEFCNCLQLSWACVSSSSNLRLMESRSVATRPPKIWIWPKMISLMPHLFSSWLMCS